MARASQIGTALVIVLSAALFSVAARAGGFDRFDQGIDLLFDPGNLVFDAGAGYVIPNTRYSKVNGAPESVPLLDNFWRPSFNIKFTPSEGSACLVTARRPFGTDIDNGPDWSEASADVTTRLSVDELGLTCSYRVPVGAAYVRAIGGVTRDHLEFDRDALPLSAGGDPVPSSLEFSGTTTGWRAGAAYEMPGLVLGLIYYAPLSFDLKGNYANLPLGGGAFFPNVPLTGRSSLPQAVEASVHGAIGTQWLAGLAVKWMDWSELAHVPLYTTEPIGGFPAGTLATDLKTYFQDGWTVTGSLAHPMGNGLTAVGRVVWDAKTTTGWTEHVSSWTVIGGVVYSVNAHLDVTAGLGVTRLSAGELDKKAEGAPFDASFDTSYALYPFINLTSRF